MVTNFAPVIVFTYNRPDYLKRVIEALQNNIYADQTDLFVYSDGAKNANVQHLVEETRNYINTITGFKSVNLICRDKNWGLAPNIVDGITTIINRFGRVIVLEDDHVTSRFFLQYMNEALELYKDNEKVASIHGYMYPHKESLPEVFFIKGADCWSWATWQRAWKYYNPDGRSLLNQLKHRHLEKAFDFDFSTEYTQMLKDQIAGRNQSWAVRWYASTFLRDMYTLYPNKSMTLMIGAKGVGTHTNGKATDRFDVVLNERAIDLSDSPVVIQQSILAYKSFKKFFLTGLSPAGRINRILCLVINKPINIHRIKPGLKKIKERLIRRK